MAATLPPPNQPPFTGGALLPGRTPVDVRGADAGFGGRRVPTPLAGVAPSGPLRTARPNRGSNITIPVSRLVHVSKKRDWAARDAVAETDHLDDGALVFVLGNGAGLSRTGQLARMPLAKGVEQFSRVCTLPALEAFFHSQLSAKAVRLDTKLVDLEKTLASSKACRYVAPPGVGAEDTLLSVTDLALPSLKDGDEQERYAQGLFAMDDGPFLRAKGGAHAMVALKEPHGGVTTRTAGDDAALSALDAAMTCAGIKAWSPDGILLSTGDSSGDMAMDDSLTGRGGLLLNTAVQGPAVTHAFAGMDVLPGDKVFVCVVADCLYDAPKVTDDLATVEAKLKAWRDGVDARQKEREELAKTEPAEALAAKRAEDAVTDRAARAEALPLLAHLFNRRCDPASADFDAKAAAQVRAAYERTRAEDFADAPVLSKEERDAFGANGLAAFRATGSEVRATVLTNFKLLRTTSAQLVETSFAGLPTGAAGAVPAPRADVYRPANPDDGDALPTWFAGVRTALAAERPQAGPGSRLRMGLQRSQNMAEMIVGGWCLGTVVDAHAVRSAVSGAKSRAASLRVSVAVRWWSGDRLWRTFMNKEGTLLQRGVARGKGGAGPLQNPINRTGRVADLQKRIDEAKDRTINRPNEDSSFEEFQPVRDREGNLRTPVPSPALREAGKGQDDD